MFTVTNTNTPSVSQAPVIPAEGQDVSTEGRKITAGPMWSIVQDTRDPDFAQFGIHGVAHIKSVWEYSNAMGKPMFTELTFETGYGRTTSVTIYGMDRMSLAIAILGAPNKYNH